MPVSRRIEFLSCRWACRIVKGSVPKHRDDHRENAIHNASESSCVGVASVAKSVVVLLESLVLKDGYTGPMMESIVQGQRTSSSHEDFGFLLAALAAFLCNGGDATEAPEGVEISETNRFVGIAEYGGEHEGAHAGKRGNDGGIGVGLVGCTLLPEPLFEKLVRISSVSSNEEQLLKEQFEMSGSSFDGCWRDPEG